MIRHCPKCGDALQEYQGLLENDLFCPSGHYKSSVDSLEPEKTQEIKIQDQEYEDLGEWLGGFYSGIDRGGTSDIKVKVDKDGKITFTIKLYLLVYFNTITVNLCDHEWRIVHGIDHTWEQCSTCDTVK